MQHLIYYQPTQELNRGNMKKTLLWPLVLTALIIYSLLVYGWLIEGNSNFHMQEIEQKIQDCSLYKICE